MLGIRASSGGVASGGGGGGAPFTIAGLFAAGEKGAYYDFTDAAKVAVNGDGSGGAPASGGAIKWAVDQSPNGNHLRNNQAANLPTWSPAGITTSGTGYGLFNMAGFGNWPIIVEPFEIVCVLEQLAYSGTDKRLLSNTGGGLSLIQGASSGAVRFYDTGYNADFLVPVASEFSIALALSSTSRTQSINGGAPITLGSGGAGLDGLILGSDPGGSNPTRTRFKRLVVVGRVLTQAERAGALAWASA